MIKKPTLIVLLLALILGGVVYYYEFRAPKTEKPAADASKPAFPSFQPSDIASFTVAHPAQPGDVPVRFEKRGEKWQITQPIQTDADQPTADGIIDALSTAQITQTEPGAPDRLKAYGLDPAQVSIEFQLQSGAKHTVLVGDKNFGGDSVYAIIDGGKDVALLPQLLSTGASKSLADLRDRSALPIDNAQVASFSLKNSAGSISASKQKDAWQFAQPAGTFADKDGVDSLLTAVAGARMVSISSETPDNLAKYGLATPAITFSASDDKGVKSTLIVGKKSPDGYYARDLSRSAVFVVNEDLYKKLSEKLADLRDKQVVHTDSASIRRIEIQSPSGTSAFTRNASNPDEWDFESPADQKGKNAAASKILDPIGSLRADEIIDHAPPAVAAQLAKPYIQVTLTDNDGKATDVRISKPSGDSAYAQVNAAGPVFKIKKQITDDLNLKPSDLTF